MIINMGDSNCKSSNMLLQSYSKETKKNKKKMQLESRIKSTIVSREFLRTQQKVNM